MIQTPPATKKSAETRTRILEAALATFRERGFDRATMREIAAEAQVATGAAYYYFDSKDAIVMAFYERAQGEMHATIESSLAAARTLEDRLQAIIQTKFAYFAPNRTLLGALAAHTDPQHPLSPFSAETAPIRDQDIAHFARAVAESKVKLPSEIAPYLPRLLWMYQMGLILFWVYDRSPEQQRTRALFAQTLKMLLVTLKSLASRSFAPCIASPPTCSRYFTTLRRLQNHRVMCTHLCIIKHGGIFRGTGVRMGRGESESQPHQTPCLVPHRRRSLRQ